jgi:hypothetical protein
MRLVNRYIPDKNPGESLAKYVDRIELALSGPMFTVRILAIICRQEKVGIGDLAYALAAKGSCRDLESVREAYKAVDWTD